VGTLLQDFRFACKLFKATPGITILAVISLALAIAASTTIFSVIYTVLLAPPIFKNASRLVVIWESNPAKGILRTPVASATFRDWREGSHTLEGLELVAPGSPVTIAGSGFPERANLQYATPGLFQLLGVQPAVGRFFSESDEASSTAPVLLSHGLWVRRYAQDASIVGQKIIVNGEVHTVCGVLPRHFHLFDMETDIWMPIALPDARSQDRTFRSWLIAVGKLRPAKTVASAQAELDVLSRRIALANPTSNKDWTARIEPIQEAQFGSWKGILYPLWGAVVFVLLISCVNVANLFLGRLAARASEISLRASLGATRRRLVVQLLNEGLLVGLFGGVLGLLLTEWGIHLFEAFAPVDFPLLHSIRLHPAVLLFCMGTALLSGALLAIIPAFVGANADLNIALKQGRSSLSRHRGWFRGAFATIQIALSLTLLIGAGLMIRSLLGVLSVDPGFRTPAVVTMQIFLSGPRYFLWRPDGVRIYDGVTNFYGQLLDRVQSMPTVQSAALVSWLPEMGYNTGRRERTFRIVDQPNDTAANQRVADFNAISADYFKTLQIPLFEGRSFKRTDTTASPWIAIVNRTFVERYCQGNNPVGKGIVINDTPNEKPREIVGVVADVRQDSLEKKPDAEIFVPYMQQPPIAAGHGYQNRVHMNLVAKVSGDPDTTVTAIRKIAAQMDDNQPIYAVRTMSAVLAEATALRRLHATLMEIFAGFALFLSAISLYGAVSQNVSERTAEIGLRMAIGATTAGIYRLFMVHGLKLILAGMIGGIVLGFYASRVLSSFLFEISVNDPETVLAVCGLLLIVSLCAIWLPARRAMRIDPIAALRHE